MHSSCEYYFVDKKTPESNWIMKKGHLKIGYNHWRCVLCINTFHPSMGLFDFHSWIVFGLIANDAIHLDCILTIKRNPRRKKKITKQLNPNSEIRNQSKLAIKNMKITLQSLLLFIATSCVSSLGLLRQTRVAATSSVRSVQSRTLFSLPEELNVLFAENNRSLLAQIQQGGSVGSMAYHSFSMSFSMPPTGPLSTSSPSVSPIDGSVTAAPDASVVPASVGTTLVPVSMSPNTGVPSTTTPVTEDSNDTIVKPIKNPAKTDSTKISKSTNRSGAGKWNPQIVIPVAFAALAVLVVVGAIVAARRRRQNDSSNSSSSSTPSDAISVDNSMGGMQDIEI
jgi:hypothetical protein